jgi:hypothetical protein
VISVCGYCDICHVPTFSGAGIGFCPGGCCGRKFNISLSPPHSATLSVGFPMVACIRLNAKAIFEDGRRAMYETPVWVAEKLPQYWNRSPLLSITRPSGILVPFLLLLNGYKNAFDLEFFFVLVL